MFKFENYDVLAKIPQDLVAALIDGTWKANDAMEAASNFAVVPPSVQD